MGSRSIVTLVAIVLAASAGAFATMVLPGMLVGHGHGVSHGRNPYLVPFHPDGRTVASCGGRDLSCIKQALGNVAYAHGALAALQELDSPAMRTQLGPSCHPVTHVIGQAALARHHGDVGAALAEGDATCQSGFYHGLMQNALIGVPTAKLGDKVRSLCTATVVTSLPDRFNNCVHGMGHGVEIYSMYDLRGALALCDELRTDRERGGCYNGAFMENFSSSYPEAVNRFVRSNDALYPCTVLAAKYKGQCYNGVGYGLARRYGGDWAAFGRVCGRVEARYAPQCFVSMGGFAAIGSNYVGSATVHACAQAPAAGVGTCLLGAARSYVTGTRSGPAAAAMCRAVGGARDRGSCFTGMRDGISNLVPDQAQWMAQCRALAGADAAACSAQGLAT